MVNGRPIFEEDVQYWLHKNSRGRVNEGTPAQIRNALEALIDQELILQRAQELGLDRNQPYQQKLRIKQADLDSLRRTEMRKLFFLRQAKQAARVDPVEVKTYFDQHRFEISTQYHILQIRKRSETEIEEVKRRLDDGATFESVAAQSYRGMPKSAGTPWDLGYLGWTQLPETWRNAIKELEVGKSSDILKGSGRLFWIIKLLDKRPVQGIDFEQVKPMIEKAIQATRVEQYRENAVEQLRAKAEIKYTSSL